jgi:hypothetical protein
MNLKWIEFIEKTNSIIKEIEKTSTYMVFFRGHSDSSYELMPSLFRIKSINYQNIENCLFYDFVSMAGSKIKNEDDWEILFNMRHCGIPTRLLDWTTSFAVALYFAIEYSIPRNPIIWILNPIKLSAKNKELPTGLINPCYDLKNNYVQLFVNPNDHKDIYRPEYPMVFYQSRNNPRIFAQQGVFTVHGKKIQNLETLANDCLYKIEIPMDCIEEAKNFLKLAGINNYSVFPDFDGLAKHLKTMYQLK